MRLHFQSKVWLSVLNGLVPLLHSVFLSFIFEKLLSPDATVTVSKCSVQAKSLQNQPTFPLVLGGDLLWNNIVRACISSANVNPSISELPFTVKLLSKLFAFV